MDVIMPKEKYRYLCSLCGKVIYADKLKPGEIWIDTNDLLCEDCEFGIENLPVKIDDVNTDNDLEEENEDNDDSECFFYN
jgi:DNA-directed RNA polymerase subunit RPC12/RpoP